ncbi:hypothetical protein MITSMUL_03734 [Mitsuokella multacida DSM 20544]|uniref:Uncharacterized protein n=1 Tax=Mitsuokella multacida DSM 20544 TaxID=500635 RepID=C9KKN4_9FIRM|nr:hypothetical protein MITSMUL_03734 [Mitsuokella multacida DSM 20544]
MRATVYGGLFFYVHYSTMMACAQVLQRPLALLRQRLAQEMAGQHRHQLAVLIVAR